MRWKGVDAKLNKTKDQNVYCSQSSQKHKSFAHLILVTCLLLKKPRHLVTFLGLTHCFKGSLYSLSLFIYFTG